MPSGLIKLIYTGNEEKIFYTNPNIRLFHTVYKNYMNFAKYPYKIDFYDSLSETQKPNDVNIYLTDIIGNFIGSVNLMVELYNYESVFEINNLLSKIEFYCTNNILDILTPRLLDIYSKMSYNESEYNLYNKLYESNHRNKYFIPLLFPCIKKDCYIPLYLLNKENLYFRISFNKDLSYKIKSMSLLIESILIDDLSYFKSRKYEWLTENVNYVENIELKTSMNGTKNNVVRLKDYFNKLTKGLVLHLDNGDINNLILRIDDNKYIFDYKKLAYINLLESGLNNNLINSESKLLLINFSLFKKYISGFTNFEMINNIDIEMKPFKNMLDIKFYAIQKLDETDNFNLVITDLPLKGYKSPTIVINRNVLYNIINNNTTIRISRNREDASEISPRPIKYSLTNLNQLIVKDLSIVELWYYDAILDTEPGKIEIIDDSNLILGQISLSIYSLNYELFNIYDGKLNLY